MKKTVKFAALLLSLALLLTAVSGCTVVINPPVSAATTAVGTTAAGMTSALQTTDSTSSDAYVTLPVTAATSDSTAATTAVTEPAVELSNLPFWEVTLNGNTMWLFGSMHVADETMYPLPDIVQQAFDGADCLAVECDIVAFETDQEQIQACIPYVLYLDGTTIADHISPELYAEAKQFLTEIGQYDALNTDYYKPSMWQSTISQIPIDRAGLDAEYGLDTYFLNSAHRTGKEIIEVESVEFQYRMSDNYSPALQEMLLRSALEELETGVEDILELYNVWRSGDLDRLYEMNNDTSDLTEEELVLYAEYDKAMLRDRNLGMGEKALELLQSGRVCFYVVGAAHMLGDDGVVAYLENAGATVTRR